MREEVVYLLLLKRSKTGLKVAYVLSLFPTIYETFIAREIRELRRQGVEVHIFSLKNSPLNFPGDNTSSEGVYYSPFLFSLGIIQAQLYFLLHNPLAYMRAFIGLLWRGMSEPVFLIKTMAIFPKSVYFARIMQGLEIDRIHAHFVSVPASSALIISELLCIPFSCTAHGFDIHDYPPPDLKLKIRTGRPFITVSEFNRRHLSGLDKDLFGSIKVVRNGIDTSEYQPGAERTKDTSVNILCVARLEVVKGLTYLVEACRILNRKIGGWGCQIIGGGTQEQLLRDLIHTYGLDLVVQLRGEASSSQVLSAYREADIFVLPSVREGIPVSLMEAMAMELASVSTKVYGIPELVEDQVEGLLVPPRDPEALAYAMETLIRDKEMRTTLGRRARLKIQREYCLQHNVGKLHRLFLYQ